ncbi:MAG: UDP-2,3-diacylglucosamine diphosphatase [Pseudomonadota bacterium]|nr:UDP-2,3-diacylglucosamine diphosphatase [Pseudomonadota bacterium]
MAETAWSGTGRDRRTARRGGLADTLLAARLRRSHTEGRIPALPQKRHRSIFISDIHLGTRGSKAGMLADFLSRNACETLFLVGDIVDGWRLKQRWYWPESHSRVVQEILHKIDAGTRAIYVPGNHDEALRSYCGRTVAGVEIAKDVIHITADGRKLLVTHGDQFDGVIAYARWLALLGDWAYMAALRLNEIFNAARRLLGLPYWSLSAYLKLKVKNAVEFICRFEDAAAREVHAKGLDGVVCGHIHHAAIKQIGAITYHNDGDWVESCTALVEDARGTMEILAWASSHSDARNPAFAAGEAAAVPA